MKRDPLAPPCPGPAYSAGNTADALMLPPRGRPPLSRVADPAWSVPLVAQQRSDALRRLEIVTVTDRPDRPAVGEGPVHGEIEAVVV